MTRDGLRISKDLALPIDAVTQKMAFLGRTGSGKTYGATKLAELMLGAGAQIVALDPVGVWYGLRLGADGAAAHSIPVLGGLHGDLPLEASAGAIVADLVIDRGISVVLDVSQFEMDAEKARFAGVFADRFFFRKKAAPSAVHLFIEECQEFVPQNPTGAEAAMLHAFTRMAKLGRNFGIGISLISQRPQEVNKKVLNMTEAMFAFQMRGPQERKTIKDWSSDKDLEIDIVAELPGLPVGDCFVSSPQWLQIEKRIRIAKKHTADVSSTPTVGAAARESRDLTPIDLEQLRGTMAAAVEKAKAEDPRELQKRIRELERQLDAGAPEPVIDEGEIQRRIDEAVQREAERNERSRRVLQEFAFAASKELTSIGSQITRVPEPLVAIQEQLGAILIDWRDLGAAVDAAIEQLDALATSEDVVNTRPVRPDPAPRPRPVERQRPVATTRRADVGNGDPTGPKQRIINAAAQLQGAGVQKPTIKQVALFVGVSHTTGSYLQNVRELVGDGYLIRETGHVYLTENGHAAARDVALPSRRELLEFWYGKLTGPQAKALRTIVDRYPKRIHKDELAGELGLSPTTGSYLQNLRDLRGYGLIDIHRGEAVATELLFPRGLR